MSIFLPELASDTEGVGVGALHPKTIPKQYNPANFFLNISIKNFDLNMDEDEKVFTMQNWEV